MENHVNANPFVYKSEENSISEDAVTYEYSDCNDAVEEPGCGSGQGSSLAVSSDSDVAPAPVSVREMVKRYDSQAIQQQQSQQFPQRQRFTNSNIGGTTSSHNNIKNTPKYDAACTLEKSQSCSNHAARQVASNKAAVNACKPWMKSFNAQKKGNSSTMVIGGPQSVISKEVFENRRQQFEDCRTAEAPSSSVIVQSVPVGFHDCESATELKADDKASEDYKEYPSSTKIRSVPDGVEIIINIKFPGLTANSAITGMSTTIPRSAILQEFQKIYKEISNC